ncbi:MAG: sulfotransferase [Planctomycetota bacterium]|nr:sulfotransferase [Planctomycetota bacterium]
MTLPSFLIVGAMKAGTTTMFEDLAQHPDIYPPDHKEPGDLNYDAVFESAGRKVYEHNFRKCRSNKMTFEASTYYTMMPTHQGSAQRARSLLGSDLKVIYIVREPVARTISHHRHIMDSAGVGPDINQVVRDDPSLIDYSRYRFQIEPWLDSLGQDKVMVVQFESYITHRVSTIEAIHSFLGVSPRGDLILPESIANTSEGKLVHTALSRQLGNTPLYRKFIRPVLPIAWRNRLKRAVSQTSTAAPLKPTLDTVNHIIEATAQDVDGIAPLLYPPVEPGSLPWDPAEVRQRVLGDRV